MAALIVRRRAWLVGTVLVALVGATTAARPAVPSRTPVPRAEADSLRGRELVVVTHGMGRSVLSMWPIKKALEAEGYEVMTFGYSSYCCSIAEIGEELRTELKAYMGPQHTRVHFVGHSLGNIIVRYVLTRDTLPPRVGRVVMLAPPNQGAHAASTFSAYAGWLLKPVPELSSDSNSTVRRLPRVRDVQIGVIAARDDRTVKLPETHLPEETAHLVVGGGHSFIMRREDVKVQTVAFLRTGHFAATTSAPLAP